MKNTSTIDQIIADIVAIDPKLSAEQLRPIVMQMLAEKPSIEPDAEFVARLQQRLADIVRPERKKSFTFNFNFMKKLSFALSGAAVIAAVALVFVNMPAQKNVRLPASQQVTKINDRGFGELSQLAFASRNQSGGGGGGAENLAIGMGGGGGVPAMDAKLYMPTNYKFTYKGETITLDSDKMAVYERQKGFGNGLNLDQIADKFNISAFNVGKFSNAQVTYLSAVQNQDYGYSVSLDTRMGTLNISQNWELWHSPLATCGSEECYQENRVKIDQLPADSEAITIANAFLDEYGIDRGLYGEPYVENRWRVEYERLTLRDQAYVPEQVNVIYPLKIENHEIYDQAGNKSGMNVFLDVRTKRVAGVGELTNQNYAASDYEVEQDSSVILKIAESGGYGSYYPVDQSGMRTVEVELGQPSLQYVRLWHNGKGEPRDLYVPSLVFPVLNQPQDFYNTNIVVPVIKDVLNSQNNVPPVRIMM